MARSSSESAVREGGIRKKMRRGTRSCFECRRRKIRCIYSAEHPSECVECFSRGSRCVDQDHTESDAIVDNRKNLRERVAKLEALVENLIENKSDTGVAEILRSLPADVLPLTPHSSDDTSTKQGSAPSMAPYHSELQHPPAPSETAGHTHASASTTPSDRHEVYDFQFTGIGESHVGADSELRGVKKAKEKRTRETLLSVLPPNDKLQTVISTNDDWWRVWKDHLPRTSRGMSLRDFATRVISDGTPQELGILLLCVGVGMELQDLHKYLAVVDALIVSDDDYAATIEGLECIIIQSKCYSEIGQPRRSWLATRKGLTYAQLLGLHRDHSASPVWDNIWWSLYQTDRFISLLLGLPYGIADSLCDLAIPKREEDNQRGFPLEISILAGKVIDRTLGVSDLSFASALELDEELDTLAASMPTGFWATQSAFASVADAASLHRLRDRLLGQICFHQIRVNLHLPFMLKSASPSSSFNNTSKFEYSRAACLGASRDLLGLYRLLRTGNGDPLYECKVVDFIGFMAAVVLVLDLLGYGRRSNDSANAVNRVQQDEGDWRLIEIMMDIFDRASTEKGGKVAAQSLRVLQELSGVRNGGLVGPDDDADDHSSKIVIPYFGTISVRRGGAKSHHDSSGITMPAETFLSAHTAAMHTAYAPNGTTAAGSYQQAYFATPAQPNSDIHAGAYPFIAFDGTFSHGQPGAGFEPQQVWVEDGVDALMAAGTGHSASWQNLTSMDIDQDWAWFWGGGVQNNVHAAGLQQGQ